MARQKPGPKVPVKWGKVKIKRNGQTVTVEAISWVSTRAQKAFNLNKNIKPTDLRGQPIKGRSGKYGIIRGSKAGSRSIKVPTGKQVSRKVGNQTVKVDELITVAIPPGVGNEEIQKAFKSFTKADYYITPRGERIPLAH